VPFTWYAVGYEMYHHPQFLLIGLHSIGSKGKLINFDTYNLRFTYRLHIFCGHILFCKAKFCDVPSQDIVKIGFVVDKKKFAEHSAM
jgi:hypothetical protein